MPEELKPCPFCGSKSIRITVKDCLFGGYNGIGTKRIKYKVRAICNKCHAMGKPIKTDWKTGSIYTYQRYGIDNDNFKPYFDEAIKVWNTRY